MASGYGKRKYISRRPSVYIGLRLQNSEFVTLFRNIIKGDFSKVNRNQIAAAVLGFLFIFVIIWSIVTLVRSAPPPDITRAAEAGQEDAADTAEQNGPEPPQATGAADTADDTEPPGDTQTGDTPLDVTYTADTTPRGNTTGNISNTGCAAMGTSAVFYRSNDSGHLYRANPDFTGNRKVYAANARYINIADGYIYFKNWDDGGSMYRIRWNGEDVQKLNSEDVGYINVIGDKIYYRGYDTETNTFGCIFRINLDGSERTLIKRVWSEYVTVYEGWIYYANWDDGGRLHRVRVDGTGDMKLNDDDTKYINAVGGYIYYAGREIAAGGETYPLYRINPDGTGRVKLIDDDCVNVNVTDEYIYYSIAPDLLRRADLDGGNIVEYPYSARDINIAGDLVFHYDGNTHYVIVGDDAERKTAN